MNIERLEEVAGRLKECGGIVVSGGDDDMAAPGIRGGM